MIYFLVACISNPNDCCYSASLEFLRDVTEGAGKAIIQRCLSDEKLLHTELLDEVPDVHRPDDQHIAARLKVPHEFKTRVGAKVQRKIKRKKKHGLYNTGDEMWMHFKPDEEVLKKWQERSRGVQESSEEVEEQAKDKSESSSDDDGSHVGNGTVDASQGTWLGFNPALRSTE